MAPQEEEKREEPADAVVATGADDKDMEAGKVDGDNAVVKEEEIDVDEVVAASPQGGATTNDKKKAKMVAADAPWSERMWEGMFVHFIAYSCQSSHLFRMMCEDILSVPSALQKTAF
jgi:hypothetical protein